MFKKENGITLVALIVSIVILLLTAGIILTISLRNDSLTESHNDETIQENITSNDETIQENVTVNSETVENNTEITE